MSRYEAPDPVVIGKLVDEFVLLQPLQHAIDGDPVQSAEPREDFLVRQRPPALEQRGKHLQPGTGQARADGPQPRLRLALKGCLQLGCIVCDSRRAE